MKIAFISLGCAKNRVNSEQMMYLLADAGYEVTGNVKGTDAVVVNTCGFIEDAKTEAIDTILEMAELKKSGDTKAIVVAGCLPERYRTEIIKELPEVDAVLGTGSFDDIVDAVKSLSQPTRATSPYISFGDINAPVSETKRIISTSKAWAYLKIADGCDNCCAYCSIPSIRGRYRSRPTDNITDEAKSLVKSGFRELILVAQDTTNYGRDIYGKKSLKELLNELNKVTDLKWLRLLYLYPDGFDNALIDEIAKSDRIVKYLDIPIQHINSEILSKMNRRGNCADISRLFSKLRERIDGVVLRTSLITGLPGEGEREFNELCEFLQQNKIERAGVFVYSPEEGTPASEMKRPDKEIAMRRAEVLQGIQTKIMTEYNQRRLGRTYEVIIEDFVGSDVGSGDIYGRSYAEAPETDGYIKIKGKKTIENTRYFETVKITDVKDNQLIGEVI